MKNESHILAEFMGWHLVERLGLERPLDWWYVDAQEKNQVKADEWDPRHEERYAFKLLERFPAWAMEKHKGRYYCDIIETDKEGEVIRCLANEAGDSKEEAIIEAVLKVIGERKQSDNPKSQPA